MQRMLVIKVSLQNHSFFIHILFLIAIERKRAKETQKVDVGEHGCSSDSFMLRDGVCDDPTNTEECIYDGGDCCLEDKATHLCRVCACIMEVDEEELQNKFDKLEVKALKNPDNFMSIVSSVRKTVTNVVMDAVCSMICVDDDIINSFNSWHFDAAIKECKCGWIDYHTEDLNDSKPVDASRNFSVAFVQEAKLFPHGKKTFFMKNKLSHFSYLLSFRLLANR